MSLKKGKICWRIDIVEGSWPKTDKYGHKARLQGTIDDWKQNSQKGLVCGILGCENDDLVWICPSCGNHYCEEHKSVHQCSSTKET